MKLIYDEHEGQGAYVKSYEGVKPPEFRQTVSEFLMSGFEIKENRSDNNSIAVMKKEGELVLIAYYPAIEEMRVVTEPNSAYFLFKDTPCNEKTDALYFNRDSLSKKGVAGGKEFAVHFKANMPVVIIGKKSAAYHS